jgi:NADH:ubiquinone oxidoreductase subunit 6 (subunit J)
MNLDHRALESEQEQRLRRARRTAKIVGIVAFAVFVVSIAQMIWLQHHPQARAQAVKEALMQ